MLKRIQQGESEENLVYKASASGELLERRGSDGAEERFKNHQKVVRFMTDPLEERIVEQEQVRVRQGDKIAVLYRNGQAILYFEEPQEDGPLPYVNSVGNVSLHLRTGEYHHSHGNILGSSGRLAGFRPIDNSHICFFSQVKEDLQSLLSMLSSAGRPIPSEPVGYPEAQGLVSLALQHGRTKVHPFARALIFAARTVSVPLRVVRGWDEDYYFKPGREFRNLFTKGFLREYDFSPEALKDSTRRITRLDFNDESLVMMVSSPIGSDLTSFRMDIFSPKVYASAKVPPEGYHGEGGVHLSRRCVNVHFFDRSKGNVLLLAVSNASPSAGADITADFIEDAQLRHAHQFEKDCYPDAYGLLTENDPRLFLRVDEAEIAPLIPALDFPFFSRDVKKLYRKTPEGVTAAASFEV